MAVKILSTVLLISVVVQLCSGSAIPMWEFLSRSEKMSHLYSTFAKQVSDYCKTNIEEHSLPVAQCKRDLLTYGLGKLQKMSETHLDNMDPYQRGANDLIWGEMMEGHPTVKNPVTSSNHNNQQSSSTIILSSSTGSNYPKNPLFDDIDSVQDTTAAAASSSYAMDMEAAYGLSQQFPTAAEVVYHEPQNHLPIESATNLDVQILQQSPEQSYLSGPMVIRVRPDGTPVEEDKWKPLPRDDDREAMQIGKSKLPTIEQIAETFNRQGRPQSQQHYRGFNSENNNYRISQRH